MEERVRAEQTAQQMAAHRDPSPWEKVREREREGGCRERRRIVLVTGGSSSHESQEAAGGGGEETGGDHGLLHGGPQCHGHRCQQG